MILYYRDKEEDVTFMKEALESGMLSKERLDEAVMRVLAMKAMLKLPQKKLEGTLMPPESGLSGNRM